jgi:hypothetical protein
MNDLNRTTEKICKLKGQAMGMQAMIISILRSMPEQQLANTLREFDQETEIARVVLLNSALAEEHVLIGFDTYVRAVSAIRR